MRHITFLHQTATSDSPSLPQGVTASVLAAQAATNPYYISQHRQLLPITSKGQICRTPSTEPQHPL